MQRVILESEFDLINREKSLILRQYCILRLVQNTDKHILRQALQGEDDRKTAKELGDHSELSEIFHGHLRENIGIVIIFILKVGMESDRAPLRETLFHDRLKVRKSPAADEQDVLRVDRLERYHRIFACRADRHFDLSPLQELQHSLLDRLPADISLIRILFLCDLVDLIDKYDAVLSPLDIVVRSREEL